MDRTTATEWRGECEKEHGRCEAVCHPRTFSGQYPRRDGFTGVARSTLWRLGERPAAVRSRGATVTEDGDGMVASRGTGAGNDSAPTVHRLRYNDDGAQYDGNGGDLGTG